MIAKIRAMEPYERVVLGICGSFTLLIVGLILINSLKI